MTARDEDELKELQDPETWEDLPDGGVRGPAKPSRAIVSVAFSREDFRKIAEHARHQGMKASEFIRNATLERLAPEQGSEAVVSVSGNVRTPYPPPSGIRAKVEIKTPEPPVRATA
jgi:hypothetical protein